MSVKLTALLAVFLLVSPSLSQATYQVVHLTEYMRHGARTTWNNHLNLSFTKNLGTGNITANGMRMHFVLGSQVRKNYPTVFSNTFKNTDFEIKSSSIYRCIMSAQAHLLGMYPLGSGETYTLNSNDHKGLPPFAMLTETYVNSSALPESFRPFPFTVSSVETDYLFFPSMMSTCPTANKYSGDLNAKKIANYNYLVDKLDGDLKAAGFDPQKLYNKAKYDINLVSFLYDEMKSYFNYFGEYYQGITQDLYNQIYRITNLNFKVLFPDEKMERLMSDGVARDIIDGLQAVVDGKSKLKFRMFSGHDTGLWNHMLRYNLTDEQCLLDLIVNKTTPRPCEDMPDFASSFLYELATKNNQYYVRILYNGSPFKVCDKNEDNFYCLYDNFKAKVQELLFYNDGDKTDFCGNPLASNYKKNTSSHTDLKVSIGIVSLVLLMCLGTIFWLMYATSRLHRKDVVTYHEVPNDTPIKADA